MGGRRRGAPVVAVTMGDPAGNGPELTVKAWSHDEVHRSMRPVAVGDARVLEAALPVAGHLGMRVNPVSSVSEARFEPGTIDVVSMDLAAPGSFPVGEVSAVAGMAAYRSVERAVRLALDGEVDATCTNALNKEALNLALAPQGLRYDGHTEIYAALTGATSYAMMLVHGDLRVVHVSTHCPLSEACARVRTPRVLECVVLADAACRRLGVGHPRIAVAGLNPHCGEGGLFGDEEADEIAPAVRIARYEGLDVEGPLPADSLFALALGGRYDAVVAMYHDQGHIPLKTVGFTYDREAGAWGSVEGVNVTLGLPVVRTSVDHGTGFDQAWRGTSSERSLVNAMVLAASLAP